MTRFFRLTSKLQENQTLEVDDVASLVKEDQGAHQVLFIREQIELSVGADFLEEFEIEKTGDTHQKKVCDRCFKLLPTQTEFENNRIKKAGITKRPSCRTCRKKKNGRPVSSRDRKIWNQSKPKNFDLFECPICQKKSIVGITRIVLDHSHSTGNVRGWLCESCNTGIGRFDDHPEIVTRAHDWLMSKGHVAMSPPPDHNQKPD